MSLFIPSSSRRQLAISALWLGAAALITELTLWHIMESLARAGGGALSVAGYIFSATIGMLMLKTLVATLGDWREVRRSCRAMLLDPYPPGLEHGRRLLEMLDVKYENSEQRNDCMYAVYRKLQDLGHYRVYLVEVLVEKGSKTYAVLRENACVLTHDGGRTTEIFASVIREQGQFVVLHTSLAAGREKSSQVVYDQLNATEKSEQMQVNTPRAEATTKAVRF